MSSAPGMKEKTEPSANDVSITSYSSKPEGVTKSPATAHAQPAPQTNGDAKVAKDAKDGKEAKLSNAELKKKAKAEKAARREREKLEKQAAGGGGAGPQVGTPDKKGDGSKVQAQGGKAGQRNEAQSSKEDGKAQRRRAGSTTAETQRGIPLRGKSAPVQPSKPKPKKDNKQVALFGHLYGQSRRRSITGTGKDVHPAVLALGLQMSNYVICGSNARCVATLLALKKVIESYTTPPGNSLSRHLTSHHLSPQIDYLVSCRSMSIAMGNAIRWLKLEISKVDPDTPEATAKADLCDGIDNFIRERITVADQVIATSAGEKIKDGDVVLTYAKSSIIQQTLVDAHRRGIRFRVIVIDSRPLFEGKHLARALANIGLEVQYSLLHGVSHAVKDATKVFLGAHAMMSNGRLYSRVGTAMVAMTANEADVPVIVCCESLKFTDRVTLDSIVSNEVAPPDELVTSATTTSQTDGKERSSPLSNWRDTPNLQLLNIMYDVTPAEYIKMVITEFGSLPPSSVPVVHRLSTNT
ncbi:MAG: hypothetical protein M1819_000297 [Sarea resinae]|nr:MAG: hypothetical protein M1819_000297 [Sarea resinae]